jgi:hypothetical protein
VFPLLIHLYSTFSINRNNGKKYYQSYIRGSIQIQIKIPEYPEIGAIDSKHGNYLASYGRSGSNNGAMDKLIFYSKENKKYLVITVFDFLQEYGQSKSSLVDTQIDGKKIFITVNKEDLASPKYGTKDNPVPVFNYKGAEKPIIIPVGNDGHMSLEPTLQEYEHNVITYLTFIMPKEEFEQRFGKQ